jgi:hypothetical protein
MPSFRRLALSSHAPSLPTSSMPALTLLEPDGPHQAQAALDTLPRACRVLAATGLYGSPTFTVLDGDDPVYVGARKYPDEETERVVLRMSSVPITPGHVLELRVLALPGGPMQHETGTNDFIEGGRGGSVVLTVTYANADPSSVIVTTSVSPPPSEAIYGAEPASGHDALSWHTAIAFPWAALPSAVDLEQWTRGGDVTVSFAVSYVGSPRVVDLQVVERPAEIVVDIASSEWPTAMYTGAGEPYPVLPSDYPITRISTADPGGGLDAVRRALEQHGAQLGPCLAWWTSAREKASTIMTWISYDGGTGDDEAPPVTGTSTDFRNIPYSTAPPLPQLPGFLLGGYARQARDGAAWFDEGTGVLPVWLVAYGKGDTNGSVQFRAGDDEWAAINVPLAVGYAWAVVPGWTEVGIGPEDAPIGRFFGIVTGVATWSVRDAGVFMR